MFNKKILYITIFFLIVSIISPIYATQYVWSDKTSSIETVASINQDKR